MLLPGVGRSSMLFLSELYIFNPYVYSITPSAMTEVTVVPSEPSEPSEPSPPLANDDDQDDHDDDAAASRDEYDDGNRRSDGREGLSPRDPDDEERPPASSSRPRLRPARRRASSPSPPPPSSSRLPSPARDRCRCGNENDNCNNEDEDEDDDDNNHNHNHNHNDHNPVSIFVRRTRTLFGQLTTSEISGSLGDLGTLIPLTVSLARSRSILLTPALFLGGLANVLTGYAWDVPVCVQPMKSIAAVAISEGLRREAVTAAGICTGSLVFVLGVTNLIEWVNVIVPRPVVSGLQAGVGFRLAGRGIRDVSGLGWADGPDCVLTALVLAAMCLYWLREKERPPRPSSLPAGGGGGVVDRSGNVVAVVPTPADRGSDGRRGGTDPNRRIACRVDVEEHPVGVYLFLLGSILAAVELYSSSSSSSSSGASTYDLPLRFFGSPVVVWAMNTVTGEDWEVGFLQGALPQLPLTTLNSVISVCALAHSLYPEKRRTPRSRGRRGDDDGNRHRSQDDDDDGGAQGTSSSPRRCRRCRPKENRNRNRNRNDDDDVISRREMSISVGLMNVILCPLGAMPNCHGAGGLAGQHRLGARHGSSVAFLGLCKMIASTLFGSSLLTLLDAFPVSVLGVMLTIAGQELAVTGFTMLVSSAYDRSDAYERRMDVADDDDGGGGEGAREGAASRRMRRRKMTLRRDAVVMTITAVVIVSTGMTHVGAASGWAAHMIYGEGTSDFMRWVRARRTERRSRRRRPR